VYIALCKGGTENSKVGIGGDSGGGTVSSSVAHDVPGLAFEVSFIFEFFLLPSILSFDGTVGNNRLKDTKQSNSKAKAPTDAKRRHNSQRL